MTPHWINSGNTFRPTITPRPAANARYAATAVRRSIKGVCLVASFYLANRYIFGRPPMTTSGAAMLALARRLNLGIAVFGIALVVLGLLFPQI